MYKHILTTVYQQYETFVIRNTYRNNCIFLDVVFRRKASLIDIYFFNEVISNNTIIRDGRQHVWCNGIRLLLSHISLKHLYYTLS